MRLVSQINRDHRWISTCVFERGVAVYYGLPVVDPRRLGIGAGVPQSVCLSTVAGFRTVIVEDHTKSGRARRSHDFVHHLQRIQPFQVGVDGAASVRIRNVRRNHRAFDHLIRVRQTNGVIAVALCGVQNRVIILCPQAVNDLIGGFKAIPVDTRNAYRVPTRVYDLISAGVPISGTLSKESPGNRDYEAKKNKEVTHKLAGEETGTHLHTPLTLTCWN